MGVRSIAVKIGDAGIGIVARRIEPGVDEGQALGFVQGPDHRALTNGLIAEKRREVDLLASGLNREVMALVRLLVAEGACARPCASSWASEATALRSSRRRSAS